MNMPRQKDGMDKLKTFIKNHAYNLDAIIESIYDGVYITDGHANTLMISKAYERITGIKREEVLGKNMRELVASGVIDRSVSLQVLEKKQPVTMLQELRSGKKILVTGNPVFDRENDEIILVVTSVRDITELVELRSELHERTLEVNRYAAELGRLQALRGTTKFTTKNKKTLAVMEVAIKAAQFDSNIFITGESGVGKGLMATTIHELSGRRNEPFVVINCAGIPEDLFESELFGYEPGAFSGASAKGKKGLLEIADKGTVFLDEIGDMSLRLQAKLLRVIEDKEMTRLGSTKMVKLNVRIISATNQEIPNLIQQKKFRHDLFFRLNTISLTLPPLRERTEDIIPLIYLFIGRLNERYHTRKQLAPEAIKALTGYYFPGNVRELSNIVEQAFLTSNAERIEDQDLPVGVRSLPDQTATIIDDENRSYNDIVGLTEYSILRHALAKYGSTHKAAKHLKISQSTIVRKLRKLQHTRD